jgi:hypothetical protein
MTDAVSRQAFSDLIGSIYDCALDPSRWERTLGDISEALDCFALLLALTDLRHERFLIHKRVGLEPDQFERFSRYLPEITAIVRGALASRPSLDEPPVMSRDLSPAYIEKSPYFQEWQKPAGMVDFMMFFLMHEPMHLSTFGVGRNEQQGVITDREIELGKLLLPHLRRAVTISSVLDIRTIEGTRMAEALDALRCAFVSFTPTARRSTCWTRAVPSKARKASSNPQLPQPHPSCAPPLPLRAGTRPALARPGWRSA